MLEAYLLALAGLDQCPSSAPPAVKERLAANVEKAERAFSDAAADGLQKATQSMEKATLNLSAANEKARHSLREAKPITALVNELERATGFALEVVGTAHGTQAGK